MTKFETALEEFTRLRPLFSAGSKWRHAKGGVYTICSVAMDEPSLSMVIVYMGSDSVVWVRSIHEFEERFTKVPQ